MMKKSKISFLLTIAEFKLLKDVVYLEPSLDDGIEKAKLKNGKYKVKFSVYDLSDSLEALSYSSSYAGSESKKERIYKLHDKIKNYLTISQSLRSPIRR